MAFYLLLYWAHPRQQITIGVILYIASQRGDDEDRVYLRLREDWSFLDDAAVEVLELLADDLQQKVAEMGPRKLIGYLEETLSNDIRLSERYPIEAISAPVELLNRLYVHHVGESWLARG